MIYVSATAGVNARHVGFLTTWRLRAQLWPQFPFLPRVHDVALNRDAKCSVRHASSKPSDLFLACPSYQRTIRVQPCSFVRLQEKKDCDSDGWAPPTVAKNLCKLTSCCNCGAAFWQGLSSLCTILTMCLRSCPHADAGRRPCLLGEGLPGLGFRRQEELPAAFLHLSDSLQAQGLLRSSAFSRF